MPWTDEGKAFLADPNSHCTALCLWWHQLVRIFCMLEHAFDGKPVLLMDGVGLGKTLQAIGIIVCLAWHRSYYDAQKNFPGFFVQSLIVSL